MTTDSHAHAAPLIIPNPHSATARLYLFELGQHDSWASTAAAHDVLVAGTAAHYRSMAIGDDGIRLSGQASADALRITAPAEFGAAQQWRVAAPLQEMFVTVSEALLDDATVAPAGQGAAMALRVAAQQVHALWVGAVTAVRWAGVGGCELVCESLSASMKRPGLRLHYQRSCPHSLYDSACGVDARAHAITARVVEVDGAGLRHDARSVGHLSGGLVRFTFQGRVEQRGITHESGQRIELLGGTWGLSPGQEITLLPGCDQTSQTCQGRFANMDNFGGFRHMPGKSPFSGDPAF